MHAREESRLHRRGGSDAGLGTGANTAIFSVLDSLLLRSLPVSHPEQLALPTDPEAHGSEFGGEGGERSLLAYSELQYLGDHHEVFSKIFAADSQLPSVDITIGNSSASPRGHGARFDLAFAAGVLDPRASRHPCESAPMPCATNETGELGK